MTDYYRIMAGRKSVFAEECFAGDFIGADYGIEQDLSAELPDNWRFFNKKFIPVFLAGHPKKSKIAAGLACGMLWTVSKGINKGDMILCPDGSGTYRVGEVTGDYYYHQGETLPHRRQVHWLHEGIDRNAMSEVLRNSTGSIGTVTTCARPVHRCPNSHWAFNNFFLWLQRDHVHECPQRQEAERGHCPERNFFTRLGCNNVTWVWLRRRSRGSNWSSGLCNCRGRRSCGRCGRARV